MNTTAPLLRARDEEIARLRADKAELVRALNLAERGLFLVRTNRPENEYAPTNMGLSAAIDVAREALAKHG